MKNYFKDLKSVSEVAKILGVSRQAVLKQINNDKLIAKKIGKSYIIYFERSELAK